MKRFLLLNLLFILSVTIASAKSDYHFSSSAGHATDTSLTESSIPTSPADTSIPDSTLILVRDYVHQVQKDWQIPGLSLSIVKDDSLVFAEGFGIREKGRSVAKDGAKVAITENTVFHIGSISKSFTAAVMASIVDDGLVSWDDPVKKVMPDFDWWDDEVEKTLKVKDLFTHSTGLVAQVGTYIPNLGYDREDIYQMLHYMQPWYQVGEKFAYNNITFIIAARIIEKVTGKSWEDNVRERIFIPLGMTSSSIGEKGYLSAGKNGSIAHAFSYVPTKDGRGKMRVTPLYGEERALHWVDVIGPAGGISSTAADMSKWVKFHLDMGKVAAPHTESHSISNNPSCQSDRPGEVKLSETNNSFSSHIDKTTSPQGPSDATFCSQVSKDSIQVISRRNMKFLHTGTTFVRRDSTSVRHYGYCWYVENNDRYDLIYHTGTTWGFTAICGFVPELRLGFALLCNSEVSEYARFAIMRRIIDLYLLKRNRENYISILALQSNTAKDGTSSIPDGTSTRNQVFMDGTPSISDGTSTRNQVFMDGTPSISDGTSTISNTITGYQTVISDAIATLFPESRSFIDSLMRNHPSQLASATQGSSVIHSEDSTLPAWPTYSSLYDWNSHFLAKWWVDKKKPSRRNVPCTIKRSKEVPDFSQLVGNYHKQAPFGDAKVTMENGKLYLTIGPKGWKHQLKHRSGNEFWMTSGGHTYPVFFHSYTHSSTAPTDFEIDFNYNENFGPWIKRP